MLERMSVPRRPLDFEDYIDIVRRNYRWILGPRFCRLGRLDRRCLHDAGYPMCPRL